MVTHAVSSKATSTIAGAGLLASIAQDPNFWVLFATAIIVSTMSFIYDFTNSKDTLDKSGVFSAWTKYVFSGLGVMFLTFYGLLTWVPESMQLPDTVWYMVAMVAAGYSTNIIRWSASVWPDAIAKLIRKW